MKALKITGAILAAGIALSACNNTGVADFFNKTPGQAALSATATTKENTKKSDNKKESDKKDNSKKADAKKQIPKPEPKDNGKNKKKTPAKNKKILPDDRTKIALNREAKAFLPDELSNGLVSGDWAIEEVNGKRAVGDEDSAPFLKFDPNTHRVYGNNGCNTLNAMYTYNRADSTISFSNVLTTLRACPGHITDAEITAALNNVKRYSWYKADSNYYLCFFDAQNTRVLSLMHQNFDFLNGTWQVLAIDGKDIDVEGMKLVIDIPDGKVHGNTGCNIINGSITTNMDAPNSISFQAIGMTRKLCPDAQWETPLVVAMEEATYARAIASDKVVLLNSHGKAVLELARTTATE